MKAMELVGVRIEVPANTPMLLLQEADGDRRLRPIYIGHPEASAIHIALEGIEPPRPLTHDLFISSVEALGATVDRVVITEVREHTFYAELHLTTDAGEQVISARPSDAVALAVRRDADIFADDDLLDEAGQPAQDVDGDEAQADEIIDEFKDFIDNVSPDDFAS
jgi:bifunctional DNase/RNase